MFESGGGLVPLTGLDRAVPWRTLADPAGTVPRVAYGGQAILTHYGAPAAVVISFEEYQRLKHAREDDGDYQLPAEIAAQISEGRQHPSAASPAPPRRPPPG